MKKLLVIICLILSFNSITAQKEYIVSFQSHKYKITNDEEHLKNFFNLQYSFKDNLKGNFYYEIQPGVILNDPAFHLDLLLTYKRNTIFYKVGIITYFGFGGEAIPGTSTDKYFLPIVGIGTYLGKRFILEIDYTYAYLTLGLGYNLSL